MASISARTENICFHAETVQDFWLLFSLLILSFYNNATPFLIYIDRAVFMWSTKEFELQQHKWNNLVFYLQKMNLIAIASLYYPIIFLFIDLKKYTLQCWIRSRYTSKIQPWFQVYITRITKKNVMPWCRNAMMYISKNELFSHFWEMCKQTWGNDFP